MTEHKRISSPSYSQPCVYNTSVTTLPVCLLHSLSLCPGSCFHCASGPPSLTSSVLASSNNSYQKSQIPVTAHRSSVSNQSSAHMGFYAFPAININLYSSAVEPFVSTTVAAPAPAIHIPTSAAPAASPTAEHQQIISLSFNTRDRKSYGQKCDRYICPTCHKNFLQHCHLRIHLRSHMGEKPFHCVHAGCRKAFSVQSNLRRHMRNSHSHTGKEPFHCTHAGCGKAFSDWSNMKRHVKHCHTASYLMWLHGRLMFLLLYYSTLFLSLFHIDFFLPNSHLY